MGGSRLGSKTTSSPAAASREAEIDDRRGADVGDRHGIERSCRVGFAAQAVVGTGDRDRRQPADVERQRALALTLSRPPRRSPNLPEGRSDWLHETVMSLLSPALISSCDVLRAILFLVALVSLRRIGFQHDVVSFAPSFFTVTGKSKLDRAAPLNIGNFGVAVSLRPAAAQA